MKCETDTNVFVQTASKEPIVKVCSSTFPYLFPKTKNLNFISLNSQTLYVNRYILGQMQAAIVLFLALRKDSDQKPGRYKYTVELKSLLFVL